MEECVERAASPVGATRTAAALTVHAGAAIAHDSLRFLRGAPSPGGVARVSERGGVAKSSSALPASHPTPSRIPLARVACRPSPSRGG
jgi:hypothetical protein